MVGRARIDDGADGAILASHRRYPQTQEPSPTGTRLLSRGQLAVVVAPGRLDEVAVEIPLIFAAF